jgi:ribonuclease HI
MIAGDKRNTIKGAEANTTNNRMELMAAIKALEALEHRSAVDLYTDSQYLRKGVLEWMENWKAKNWKTAARKPVKNRDLWERLDQLLSGHEIAWHWVKGHAGNPGNEKADQLANQAIDSLLLLS